MSHGWLWSTVRIREIGKYSNQLVWGVECYFSITRNILKQLMKLAVEMSPAGQGLQDMVSVKRVSLSALQYSNTPRWTNTRHRLPLCVTSKIIFLCFSCVWWDGSYLMYFYSWCMMLQWIFSLYWGYSPFKFPFSKRCGPECWRQSKNLKTLHSHIMIYIRFIHQVRLVYRFNATVRREVNRQSIIRAMQIPEKLSFCNSAMYFVGGIVELLNYH